MINSAPIQLEVSLASVLTDLFFQTGPVQVRIENLIFSRNIFLMQHVIIFFIFWFFWTVVVKTITESGSTQG